MTYNVFGGTLNLAQPTALLAIIISSRVKHLKIHFDVIYCWRWSKEPELSRELRSMLHC